MFQQHSIIPPAMITNPAMTAPSDYPIRRALISVSDKTGLAALATRLRELDIEIISTGGTATYLRDHGIPVIPVSEVTKFPEILEGRVKTLHPAIHGAILANMSHSSHRNALKHHNISPIGLVVINLYQFEAAVAKKDADPKTAIEAIDVGGPAMIRAAAKNHESVAVLTDPADYDAVITEMETSGRVTSFETRRRLAAKAFGRTAAYDAAIAAWFASEREGHFPQRLTITGHLRETLRYGENSHQSAAVYATSPETPGLVSAKLLQGKELSYNNLADADAAFHLISEFPSDQPATAIIKHANPSGVALGNTLLASYEKALAADPVSAFGGIVALNSTLDEETARAIVKVFTEVVIAPSVTDEARKVLSAKPNIRVLAIGTLLDLDALGMTFKSIAGGFLVQDADAAIMDAESARTVTARAPTTSELADLLFAMRVAKHVKSNAIVFAKDNATLGIGAGQMSRVDSVKLAVAKAKEVAKAAGGDPDTALQGAAVASDAFFPFADGLIAAADAGATTFIQPGGSVRDQDVIDAANARDLAMVFTGTRHFRH